MVRKSFTLLNCGGSSEVSPIEMDTVSNTLKSQDSNFIHVQRRRTTWQRFAGRGERPSWDDEFVLKRQFSAIIPTFDPRPGRTNVNQYQDFKIPAPGTEPAQSSDSLDQNGQPKIVLYIKAPCLPGMENIEVCLGSETSCIFKFIQKLLVHGMSGNRNERIQRIWELTYTIVYRTLKEGETRQDLEKITDSMHSQTGAQSDANTRSRS